MFELRHSNRRDFLTVGAIAPLGLSLAGTLRAEASGPTPGSKLRIAQWLAVLPNGGRLAAIAQAPSAAFDAAWPDFKAVAESVEAR